MPPRTGSTTRDDRGMLGRPGLPRVAVLPAARLGRPLRLRLRIRSEDGSAPIEFIFVGVILLVPIVYLILTLAAVQSHAFGAETTARQIVREIQAADGDVDLDVLASRIAARVGAEYGMDPESVRVHVSCTTTGPCPAAGATIVVTVTASVVLPFVPAVLGLDDVARIGVEGSSVVKLSRVWGGGE